MIPLLIKDFTWNQTPSSITITVPIRGVTTQRTNLTTSPSYIRIHFHPYVFEVFLCKEVDDEKGNCTIDVGQSRVILQLPKILEGDEWPTLENKSLDKDQKKEIREQAVTLGHQRHKQKIEKLSLRQAEERRMTVSEQIRLDGESRQRIDDVKKSEGQVALLDIDQWTKHGPPDPTVPEPEPVEQLKPTPLPKLSSSPSHIWPASSSSGTGSGDCAIVGIRSASRIQVQFTPREFPTPARESHLAEEEEWLKKQTEARKISGFDETDLRPHERDPTWLLNKGISLMKIDSPLGAISAFSLGIKLSPKLPELYVQRAKAHYVLENFMKCVEDASQGLELLTPKVAANVGDRYSCHRIRGLGFQALKMYAEGIMDVNEALLLSPDDQELINHKSMMQQLLDNENENEND